MTKRKASTADIKEILDFQEVTEPIDSVSVHAVVSDLCPKMKKGRFGEFFDGKVVDAQGHSTMRFLGFNKTQFEHIKTLNQNMEPIQFINCQIQNAKRGPKLEVMLKTSTKIMKSPKKIDTSKIHLSSEPIALFELDAKDEYEKISVKVKVLEEIKITEVSQNRKVQELLIADSSASTVCSIWQASIGTMKCGKCYHLENFMVRDFGQRHISQTVEGSKITEIEDIGPVTANLRRVEITQIKHAQIIGIAQLVKYRCCHRCRARVEPTDPPTGRCTQPECDMMQLYHTCEVQLSTKLLFLDETQSRYTLSAYGQMVQTIANSPDMDSITEEVLLALAPFQSISFNSNSNIITAINE